MSDIVFWFIFGKKPTDGDNHVNVNLPISQSREQIFNVVFVGESSTILPETGLDFTAFVLGQKSGTVSKGV
jgi:hypothetical protein